MSRSALRSSLFVAVLLAVATLVPVMASAASGTPELTVSAASVREGDTGHTNLVFTVRLHRPPGHAVTVDYATAAGSASAHSDFVPTTGTLTFRGTTVARHVAVPVVGDRRVEPDETFHLRLSDAHGAAIETRSALGTIRNDDELLSLSGSGDGAGTVTSDPVGISCSGTCSHVFPLGTVVELHEQASAGSAFAGWSGACSGTGACSVTMSGPHSVGAGFSLLPLESLTVTAGTGGTVTSADASISCGIVCQASYPQGTPVDLTATPDSGWVFANWIDQDAQAGCTGATSPCSLVMQSGDTVTAQFLRLITVTVAGPGKVYLGPQQVCPDPTSGSMTCQVAAPASDSRSFMAVSDVDGVFRQWQASGCGATSTFTTCVVDPGGPVSIAAIFDMKPPPGP